MDFSFSDLNYNFVETLSGFEARAAFTVNSAPAFKEGVDIVNYIRLNPEFFIEWHQSVIALRFAVQRNREVVCAAGIQK